MTQARAVLDAAAVLPGRFTLRGAPGRFEELREAGLPCLARSVRGRRRAGKSYPVLAGTASQADEADSRVSSAAVRRELAAALAGLAAGDRDVLLMVAWADLSYAEVAASLRIPVGTVRSRLHRARTRIRAALGGYDPTSVHEEREESVQ